MPIECAQLDGAPVPLRTCPDCGRPFSPAFRGMVQRTWLDAPWTWLKCWWAQEPYPYCSIICEECWMVVGYEAPPNNDTPGEPT